MADDCGYGYSSYGYCAPSYSYGTYSRSYAPHYSQNYRVGSNGNFSGHSDLPRNYPRPSFAAYPPAPQTPPYWQFARSNGPGEFRDSGPQGFNPMMSQQQGDPRGMRGMSPQGFNPMMSAQQGDPRGMRGPGPQGFQQGMPSQQGDPRGMMGPGPQGFNPMMNGQQGDPRSMYHPEPQGSQRTMISDEQGESSEGRGEASEGSGDASEGPAADGPISHGRSGMFTCPMHPEIKLEGPGACPKCHMDLIPAKG